MFSKLTCGLLFEAGISDKNVKKKNHNFPARIVGIGVY